MNDSNIIIEEVNNPAEVAPVRAAAAQLKRNGDWLQAHWADVLPQARDKFPAVAGQEAHRADTLEAARDCARAARPDDYGAFRRHNAVLLLVGNHWYQVVGS